MDSFKSGDKVILTRPMTSQEVAQYKIGWLDEMDELVGQEGDVVGHISWNRTPVYDVEFETCDGSVLCVLPSSVLRHKDNSSLPTEYNLRPEEQYRVCYHCGKPLLDNQLVKDAYKMSNLNAWTKGQLRTLADMATDRGEDWIAKRLHFISQAIKTFEV